MTKRINKNSDNKIIPIHAQYHINTAMQKNILGRQLLVARQKKKYSLVKLADKLALYGVDISAPSINKWEKGTHVPNAYQLFALCRALDIKDGVRYFSGLLTDEEEELNEEGLKKLEVYRQDLIASGRYKVVLPDDDVLEEKEYPVYDFPVSAGTGTFLDDNSFRMASFQTATVPAKAEFAVTVRGDSMMPNYTDGQLVWVKRTMNLRHGQIGVFVVNGNAYMKMYTEVEPGEDVLEDYTLSDGSIRSQVVLVSLNKNYEPIVIGPYDTLKIIGCVLTK